jgi:citrate/tricarballylate utilization protein
MCNACGYCHGYCQVFNLSRLYSSFADNDLSYLANICHDCRACLDACQYAKPHEFHIDVPDSLRDLRHHTYKLYGRPRFVADFLGRSKYGGFVLVVVAMLLSVSVLGLSTLPEISSIRTAAPTFYDAVSWQVMMLVGAVPAAWSLTAIARSTVSFWRDIWGQSIERPQILDLLQTLCGIFTWHHFGALSHGCQGNGLYLTFRRKYLHLGLLYGCISCFAATVVGTIYHHILGQPAPYAYTSLPVILGTVGGGAIMVGAIGLFIVGPRSSLDRKADVSLLPSLSLVAFTGLSLLLFRESRAMTFLLTLHLGAVVGFFLSIPYGHFLHGPFRAIAMLRAASQIKTNMAVSAKKTQTIKLGPAD